MKTPISELISKADIEIVELNHAPSTLWQYRWAWQRFEVFCSEQGIHELTDEALAMYLQFLTTQHSEGQLKEWKYKLLRKSALVLSEVNQTGTYQWKISKHIAANDGLNSAFRPVQEQFQSWLTHQGLAQDTQDLYATIARRTLASWQDREITNLQDLTGADVAAAVVSLTESYQPGSMRTVLTSVRVLCRFLEDTTSCSGLSGAVPRSNARRVRHVSILPAETIEQLTNSPDPVTVVGRRDRAMLLLGARTGLRPVDIVALRLQDIDWRQGVITLVQHKTGTVLSLPLLADVGQAIADYILHERPTTANDDHVFLRTQAPFVALAPSSKLHDVASRAFTRAGIESHPGMEHGFRVLRASFATSMLEDDTPLPVIAGALGHRGISSVKHYLSADEERMRQCCLDFAGIEPREAQS